MHSYPYSPDSRFCKIFSKILSILHLWNYFTTLVELDKLSNLEHNIGEVATENFTTGTTPMAFVFGS